MFEGPEEIKHIKKLFDTVLGADTIVKDNIKATESTVFEILIQKADDSLNLEDKLGEMNIDITKITDPLWFVIENQFKLIYGEEAAEIIMWYLMERLDEDNNVVALEDEDENKIILNKPIDLWKYLQKNIFNKDLEK
jgi:hypothetical protein